MAGIGLTPCRTMRAEDIRELERRARHARRVSSRRRAVLECFEKMIERAHDLTQRIGGNARVESRGVEFGMAEQS
jgi:alkylhydroperoxidase family enzyme